MDTTDMTTPSSMPKSRALPDAWIERLFQRMEDRYGSMWADRYGSFPRARVMATWAEDLGDMTREELVRGVDACRSRKFPPTLPEFRELCRPPLDAEDAYYEAIEQMRRRQDGLDAWSSPVVFWAAVSMGSDLSTSSYPAIRSRWQRALEQSRKGIETGQLSNIVPQRMGGLPAPGAQTVTAEDAQRRAAELKRRIGQMAQSMEMPA